MIYYFPLSAPYPELCHLYNAFDIMGHRLDHFLLFRDIVLQYFLIVVGNLVTARIGNVLHNNEDVSPEL